MNLARCRKLIRNINDNKQTLENTPVNRKLLPVMQGGIPDKGQIGESLFRIPEKKCYFYYGPAGTGKKQMAEAFAGSLHKAAGFDCYEVRNTNLPLATYEELMELVDTLVTEAQKNRLFFYMENPGQTEKGKYLMDSLLEEMEAYQDIKLVLVISDTDCNIISADLQDQVVMCRFELPDLEERQACLDWENFRIGKTKNGEEVERTCLPIPKELGTRYLAEQTEGFTYSQLKQVMNKLKLQMTQRAVHYYEQSRYEAYQAMVDESFPCTKEDIDRVIREVRRPLYNMNTDSYEEIRLLLDRIVGILQSAGYPVEVTYGSEEAYIDSAVSEKELTRAAESYESIDIYEDLNY